MTKADTVRIMAILRTAYPNYYKGQQRLPQSSGNVFADLAREGVFEDA